MFWLNRPRASTNELAAEAGDQRFQLTSDPGMRGSATLSSHPRDVWWKKKIDLMGLVAFQGNLAPSLESLSGLERAGVDVTRGPSSEENSWTAELEHASWGRAFLEAPRQRQPLTDAFTEFSPGLTPGERQRLSERADYSLVLRVPAQKGDVLRDRKRLLHFMSAVLGDEGEGALDVTARTIWTRNRLFDELAHEAPLDIIQVHVLHVVDQSEAANGEGDIWLHSHGLAEMGFVDFDVLRPAQALLDEQFDVLRAIAFAVVEGASSGTIQPVLGGQPVVLVPASTFMGAAAEVDRALRDPEDHTEARVVCCDPKPRGAISRLFRKAKLRPSTLLSRGMVEGKHLVHFSVEATELCAERARECLSLFGSFREEFQEMECMALAKLGYPTDNGGEDGREHLWFEVHGVHSDHLDATLLNDPFDIADMQAGQRGSHPIEQLTDWSLMTPAGQLTPRSLELARTLRELRPEILRAMAEDAPAT